MGIIKYKKIFLTFSGILVTASAVAIITLGFNPGIDFIGGTLWNISLTETHPSREDVQKFFADDLGIGGVVITEQSDGSMLLRTPEMNETDHSEYILRLNEKFGVIEELRFETIGATIGKELRTRAIYAVILVLVAISLYIAFAFKKVSHPVSSWKYGIITLVTLFHDALIPAGAFAVAGYMYGLEIDTNFIVALLVVMGFSVHDTIVVFDRIRENLSIARNDKRENFDTIVGESISQTIARSVNTSLTLLVILVALYLFGAPSLTNFILVILIGTVIGTYSSICLASPLLTVWRRKV